MRGGWGVLITRNSLKAPTIAREALPLTITVAGTTSQIKPISSYFTISMHTSSIYTCRRREHPPKTPTLTFFVNESSDGFGEGVEGEGEGGGSADTSLVLPNKHTSCGK